VLFSAFYALVPTTLNPNFVHNTRQLRLLSVLLPACVAGLPRAAAPFPPATSIGKPIFTIDEQSAVKKAAMQLFTHTSKLQARWVTTRAQLLLPPHLSSCINSSRNSSSLSPSSITQLLHAQVQPVSCSNSSTRWHHSAVVAAAAEAVEAAAAAEDEQQPAGDWTVLNFYHLVDIADPEEVRSFLLGLWAAAYPL
jgi:hypothetical protein